MPTGRNSRPGPSGRQRPKRCSTAPTGTCTAPQRTRRGKNKHQAKYRKIVVAKENRTVRSCFAVVIRLAPELNSDGGGDDGGDGDGGDAARRRSQADANGCDDGGDGD